MPAVLWNMQIEIDMILRVSSEQLTSVKYAGTENIPDWYRTLVAYFFAINFLLG